MGERFPPRESGFGRLARRIAPALFAAAAIGAYEARTPEQVKKDPHAERAPDTSPFTETHPNGEYTTQERAERTRRLPHGEEIFVDAGLTFYRVEPGDTIDKIRAKLLAYPDYAFLTQQKHREQSFNMAPEALEAGMWIPLPLDRHERMIDDEAFADHCRHAIAAMRSHRRYGKEVRDILTRVSENELVASMIALAKKESGGTIGSNELHRWEPKYRTYSYSVFHILMEGAGLRARKHLDMTEGQTVHPENAAKLLLAFLCEKGDAPSYFPIDQRAEKVAAAYNGAKWKKYHPQYPAHLTSYYATALAELNAQDSR